jgi:hypothetical protein
MQALFTMASSQAPDKSEAPKTDETESLLIARAKAGDPDAISGL